MVSKGLPTTSRYLVPVAETVFVIPAKAGIQFFALDPCFRRGDIVDFRFPQQILLRASDKMKVCSYRHAEQSEASGIRKGLEILRYTPFRSE